MEFPSKKDVWLYFLFILLIGACFTPIVIGREHFLLFFTIPLAALLIWSWLTTKYIVEEDRIMIQSGFLKKSISIKDIKTISYTKNPQAAYALSFQRLEILYGAYETELISPQNEMEFISLVKSKNPQIQNKKSGF
ncbi:MULTISPECIES: PH domain-containing protein [unclassified Bacillus cereus group]|uniref:PH domain-containing protein n=1 Tax=unclassified Bacillus cereus group TaxID=2750818 RepID=UPI001F5835C3|nr:MULTISPECIES: PH domain-containing protein [unclassified Bacillus cereus group]